MEVVDFVEEGQAEAFLAMDIRERIKKHAYPDIEKVGKHCLEKHGRNMNCLFFFLLQGGKT